MVSPHTEFTIRQAADFLNVTRPYLEMLLEQGKIPCRKADNQHLILFRDLDAYQQLSKAQRTCALDELTAQAQKLDMGY